MGSIRLPTQIIWRVKLVEKLEKKIIDPPVQSDKLEPGPGIYTDLNMIIQAHEWLELNTDDVPELGKYSENSQEQKVTFQMQAMDNVQNIIIKNKDLEMVYNGDSTAEMILSYWRRKHSRWSGND